MRLDDLDYDLPEELIAQAPLPQRDASRLMVLDVASERIEHRAFVDLPALIAPSLFVFNDTRVFPARLRGSKESGGRVELLLLRKVSSGGERWLALARASKALRSGAVLDLQDGRLRAEVRRTLGGGQIEIELDVHANIEGLIEEIGEVPLPPYIHRSPTDSDKARYQTIYARKTGAVAAPTAGLHFTPRMMSALELAGHETAYVTLHVGPGTFRPVQTDALEDHEMHEEAYDVPPATVDAAAEARARGRDVIAVGTTVARTLEAAAQEDGNLAAGAGETRLFIKPPYRVRLVDHLLTNFHLPRSTLLALVMALAGVDLTQRAYGEAIEERYRFYSYGDAMLIRGVSH
jgi:S-adenosylmethionine:tRNA ribosyltransferase-isomerase